MGMGGIAVQENPHCGEMGYSLLPPYWGRGFATMIAQWLIDYGFSRLGLQTMRAVCDTRNKASIKVLEKSGMTIEGYRRGLNQQEIVYRINFTTANTIS